MMSKAMAMQVTYDKEYDRLMLGEESLHCGDTLTVLVVDTSGAPTWVRTSVEYNEGWYLTGAARRVHLVGLWAQR